MSGLITLATDIVLAKRGNRELDARIYYECFCRPNKILPTFCLDLDGKVAIWVPEYTSCLLTAMKLVPPGWQWLISNRAVAPHTGRAYLNNGKPLLTGLHGQKNPDHLAAECTAFTPALAVCAASMRARAA